ncbi:MAG TPA: zf-HC2 domain-containing protein [Dermatophilaceae bacterium]|nr:zf-HC2 domain-containing protein [Dermatophilaceae bacterium]
MTAPLGVGATGHLGAHVSGYVDRTLGAGLQLALDRHVAVCPSCREAAQDERRLLGSLRSAALAPPSGLAASLLRLSQTVPAPAAPAAASATWAPWAAPNATRQAPVRRLPVLPAGAPPMHRSPVRAAMAAGLAVGASAAAAVGIGLAGMSAVATGTSGTPSVSPGRAPSTAPAATAVRVPSGAISGAAALMAPRPPTPSAGRPQRLGPWGGADTRAALRAQSVP